jgi:hypothetical protein
MAAPESSGESPSAIKIEAGANIENITVGGDVAGRDIVKITEELAYDVSDVSENPYLGLASYTYATRAFYGGREQQVREVTERMTAPGAEPVLLFVTGASGSGKSSFVQAGLLPALEQTYLAHGRTVRWSVMRPGRNPVAALAEALSDIGVPEPADGDLGQALRAPEDLTTLLAGQMPRDQVTGCVRCSPGSARSHVLAPTSWRRCEPITCRCCSMSRNYSTASSAMASNFEPCSRTS